ncbi:ABC transporter permease subunit [Amylibacter sp. SFDW26]|uniref:ABC transporter permease n=1 Tax=Amylibacter sp. SFDW26 TaxID=2652722 RepID=UPI001261CE68|nr:ABC transporter permease [Amylibacter sp. SFDW26]KAB7616222.1 ABC transporter permease subunit [Amylibacter sp. SFDW26]
MSILGEAIDLVLSADAELGGIVGLSLRVSLTATLIASILAIPLGAALAVWNFRFRQVLIVISTSLMALPPVVVGLMIYLLLSRAGPLGSYGILFTPMAMIIAQSVLIFPIVLALTREAILPINRDYKNLLDALNVTPVQRLKTLIWDARFAIVTALLAGFGRALAEVGAVIIVGGNIAGFTRVMTTTIALETSKGNLQLALALGIILLSIAFAINILIHWISSFGRKYQVTR